MIETSDESSTCTKYFIPNRIKVFRVEKNLIEMKWNHLIMIRWRHLTLRTCSRQPASCVLSLDAVRNAAALASHYILPQSPLTLLCSAFPHCTTWPISVLLLVEVASSWHLIGGGVIAKFLHHWPGNSIISKIQKNTFFLVSSSNEWDHRSYH